MTTATAAIEIKGEKQIAWAGNIAAGWVRVVEIEIETTEKRVAQDAAEGKTKPAVVAYLDALVTVREKLVASLGAVTAKQIIDMHTAGRNYGKAAVKQALEGKA